MVFSKFKRRHVPGAPQLIGLVALLLLLLLLLFSRPFAQPDLQALTIAQLQTVGVPNAHLPPMEKGGDLNSILESVQGEQGTPIRLPFHQVHDQSTGLARFVYAITLDDKVLGAQRALLDADARNLENVYGVLFVQLVDGGDFYLNGRWVSGLNESTQAERWMWYQPFVVALPSHLLNTDGRPNVLTVAQTTHSPYISIPRSYFGDLNELNRVSHVISFFGTTLANAVNALCLVMGLLFIGVWVASKKRDQLYALAGGASIAWTVLFVLFRLNYAAEELRGLWRWCIYLCEGGFMYLMTVFVLSFIKRPLGNWPHRAFLIFVCIAPMVFLVGGPGTERYLDLLWTPALFMFYVYAISRLMGYCWKTRSLLSGMLLLQSVIFLLLVCHGYAVQTHLIDKLNNSGLEGGWSGLWFEHIYLAHLGMPFLLLIVSYILLVEHRNNLTNLANVDVDMDLTMRQQKTELTKIHQQRELVAISTATRAERDRIFQDIHDGIGSQLIKAIFTLRNDGFSVASVVDNLQACLRDLRLVIDADTESVGDVQALVFAFCVTQELQLSDSSLSIGYQIGPESTVYADPKVNLNILRVLQESISNTLKHSDATSINITLALCTAHLTLTITDNGHGHSYGYGKSKSQLSEKTAAYGDYVKRGITGLSLRAADIGAKYTIDITEFGTTVCLAIPVPSNVGSELVT